MSSPPPAVPELGATPTPAPNDTAPTPELENSSSSDSLKEDVKSEPAAVHEADAPVRAIAFPDEKETGTHAHVGGTGAFPRVGTKELRRELTKDDKELANAGYEGLKEGKNDEAKQVDIVSRRRVTSACERRGGANRRTTPS